MNEVIKAIEDRRSIRKYVDKDVEADKVKILARSAVLAPSAKNEQKWLFNFVTNKEILKKISDISYERGKEKYPFLKARKKIMDDAILFSAPLFVVITSPLDYYWADVDCSIAAENIVLSAHSIGLGTCYIGMVKYAQEELKELLNIPDNHKFVIGIAVGYADENPAPRSRNNDVVRFID